MTPLTLPDGSVWQPSPVEVDRIWHALQEQRFRPVMARLAWVRRHGKGGGLVPVVCRPRHSR